MPYYFYIDGVALPITPSKLQLKIKGNNKTITLINDGEVNLIKTPGLTEVSFECMLPMMNDYPFTNPGLAKELLKYQNWGKKRNPKADKESKIAPTEITAKSYLDKFENLKNSKKPFQFIVSRCSPKGTPLFDTNIKVSLENYEISEDANDGFDIMVNVNLLQYEDYGTKRIIIKKSKTDSKKIGKKKSRPQKSPAKTYTVKKGDNLWTICKKELGNALKYKEVAKKNNIKNPNLIYPGQVLKL